MGAGYNLATKVRRLEVIRYFQRSTNLKPLLWWNLYCKDHERLSSNNLP